MIVQTALRHVYLTKGLADIVAFGSSFAKGFCDGCGAYDLSSAFLYLPVAAQTVVGAANGFVEYLVEEGDINRGSAVVGGSAMGAFLGTVEMGLGYSVGHTLGSFART